MGGRRLPALAKRISGNIDNTINEVSYEKVIFDDRNRHVHRDGNGADEGRFTEREEHSGTPDDGYL